MRTSTLVLCSPNGTDRYDYDGRVAEVNFDFARVVPNQKVPSEENWREFLRSLHEYAHFYQFATTSYGFLVTFFGFCRAALVHGFLVVLRDAGGRYSRPLVKANDAHGGPRNPSDFALAMLVELLRVRAGLFGLARFPVLDKAAESSYASVGLWHFIKNSLGMRKMMFGHSMDYVPDRYRIDEILESHAHALSTLWLVGLIRRADGPERLVESVIAHHRSTASGPYREFLTVPCKTSDVLGLWLYCALCDIALNPPLFAHEGKLKDDTELLLFDSNWNPVHRLWQLFVGLSEHPQIPGPESFEAEGWEQAYREVLLRHCSVDNEFVAEVDEAFLDRLRSKVVSLPESELPIFTRTIWMDSLGTYKNIGRVRKVFPLLLSGLPMQFQTLIATVGAPNIVTGALNRQYIRPYMGLCALDMMTWDEVKESSPAICAGSIREHVAIERLLYASKESEDWLEAFQIRGEEVLKSFLASYAVGGAGLT